MTDSSTATGTDLQSVSSVVHRRRTAKRLQDPATVDHGLALTSGQRDLLKELLTSAGAAPYHKRAHESHRAGALRSPVPWRFHVLQRDDCLALNDWLQQQAERDGEGPWARAWGSKMPALLAGAGALVIVTWLPDPAESGAQPEMSMNNVEHIAAASAATQNLLLLAEAAGWSSYWSSGGILRDAAVFKRLGIATAEQLLGAIQLAPQDFPADKIVPGGLHDQRGETGDWMRAVRSD